MTRTKEQIEAEIAALQTELAKLDAPDPLLIEAREICADHWERRGIFHFAAKIREGVCDDNSDVDSALAALRRGMELAAAPLMPTAAMTDAEIEELAHRIVAENYGGTPEVYAIQSIRATIARLGHGRKAWPSEAELERLWESSLTWQGFAKRIRERVQ